MKSFIAKLKTWLTRLAFWRKPAAPATEAENGIDDASNSGDSVDSGTPQPSRFARLKQALRWRRKAARQPLDPEQTVVVERPSRERLEAAESASESEDLPPQLSWFARLKKKFRRQPKLEALDESDETDDLPVSTKRSATEDEETEEETPRPGLFKRLKAVFAKKWVWIPSVSAVVLALVGGVVFMLLQAGHEKEKLQAELLKAQKKIEQQAAVVKQATATKQAAAIEASPEQVKPAPIMIGAANSDSKPGVNAGDCVVTSKESVAASLKGCIDSFNAGAGANKKKP